MDARIHGVMTDLHGVSLLNGKLDEVGGIQGFIGGWCNRGRQCYLQYAGSVAKCDQHTIGRRFRIGGGQSVDCIRRAAGGHWYRSSDLGDERDQQDHGALRHQRTAEQGFV